MSGKWKSPCLRVSVVSLLLLGLCAGCGQKIGEEARALLATNALAAKERAVAFSAIAPQLHAKAAPEDPGVQRWAGSHAEGLASQAKALADLSEAVKLGALNKATVIQIKGMAETAAARAESFRAMTPKVDWKWPAFVETHQAALDLQAQQLAQLYEKVKPKEKQNP